MQYRHIKMVNMSFDIQLHKDYFYDLTKSKSWTNLFEQITIIIVLLFIIGFIFDKSSIYSSVMIPEVVICFAITEYCTSHTWTAAAPSLVCCMVFQPCTCCRNIWWPSAEHREPLMGGSFTAARDPSSTYHPWAAGSSAGGFGSKGSSRLRGDDSSISLTANTWIGQSASLSALTYFRIVSIGFTKQSTQRVLLRGEVLKDSLQITHSLNCSIAKNWSKKLFK